MIRECVIWSIVWILLLLSVLTSCLNDDVTVETYIGGNASFRCDYTVPPFYGIRWLFEKTQIAETLEENISQHSLSINKNYTWRFYLLENDKIGFNLTNVERQDKGNYKCILTLSNSDILKFKWRLDVTDRNTHGTSTSRPAERTTPTPKPGEHRNILAIVLGVLVPVIAIGLSGLCICMYKRRSERGQKAIPLKQQDQ